MDLQKVTGRVTDLTYLKEASAGNVQFIREMVDIFLRQTPPALKFARELLNDKQWEKFRQTVHKTKPTIAMVGITGLVDDVKTMENLAKEESEFDRISEILEKVNKVCAKAYIELEEELNKLA